MSSLVHDLHRVSNSGVRRKSALRCASKQLKEKQLNEKRKRHGAVVIKLRLRVQKDEVKTLSTKQ